MLIGPLAHVGIALATALSNAINATLLTVILLRRGHLRLDARLRRVVPRIVLATLAMAAVLLLADRLLPLAQPTLALAVTILLGGATYAAAAVLLGAADPADLKRQLSRRGPAAEPGA